MANSKESLHILHELEPVVESELNRHEQQAQPWHPHDYVPWSEGRNFGRLGGKDWEPTQSKLGKVAQTAMRINLLTEDNLPSYHREIADQFTRDGAWGTWVNRWTAEENRHSIALRDYLVVTRAIDPVELEQARMQHMNTGYDSGDKMSLRAIAYVTMQELATRIAHRNTGKVSRADGDVLADELLQRISKDENLHMVFYRNLGRAALDIAPNEMMRAVTDEVVGFQMPGASIPNFARDAVVIAKAGIYDLEQHVEEVVDPTLKYWNVATREDLTDDGARARDELYVAMDSLRTRVERNRQRKEERRQHEEAAL